MFLGSTVPLSTIHLPLSAVHCRRLLVPASLSCSCNLHLSASFPPLLDLSTCPIDCNNAPPQSQQPSQPNPKPSEVKVKDERGKEQWQILVLLASLSAVCLPQVLGSRSSILEFSTLDSIVQSNFISFPTLDRGQGPDYILRPSHPAKQTHHNPFLPFRAVSESAVVFSSARPLAALMPVL